MKLLIALALLMSAPALQAETLFVRPSGSNANPCTQSQPCQSIAHGISRLSGGDTLLIGGGTYPEGPLPTPPSGLSSSQRTAIRAMPGEQVLVVPARTGPDSSTALLSADANYLLITGINLDAQFNMGRLVSLGAITPSDNVILCNMNLQGSWSQGISGQAVNSAFVNVEIHHTGQYYHPHGDQYCPWRGYHHAVYLGGESDMSKETNNVFDGVYVHDIPDGHGLQLYSGGVTVRNSRIENLAVGNGIFLLGQHSSVHNTSITNVGGEPIAGPGGRPLGQTDASDRSATSACEGGGAPPRPRLPRPTHLRVRALP
jgi:hypothetical protein